jgi:hypothetical protein
MSRPIRTRCAYVNQFLLLMATVAAGELGSLRTASACTFLDDLR